MKHFFFAQDKRTQKAREEEESRVLLDSSTTPEDEKTETVRKLAHIAVIPFYKKLIFALPLLFENFIRFFHHMYIKLYFVEHMKKLNAFSWAASVETASLFIVMPLVGYTLDSIKGGRYGRRLPALLIFIPLFSMTCIPMSIMPGDDLTDLETSAWFQIWGFFHNLFGQTWHVIYLALALGLTDDFDERSTLFLIGGLAATLGGLGGASLPAYIPQDTYIYLMSVITGLFLVTALLAAVLLREKSLPAKSVGDIQESGEVAMPNDETQIFEKSRRTGIMGLVPSLVHCFRNHPYVILWLLMVFSYSIISPTLPLLLTYGFGIKKGELSNLTMASMGASIAGSLFWLWTSLKIGKKATMQLGLVGMALSLIIVLFVPSDGGGWEVWLFVTIPQFFNPAIHDLNKAMLADVVDYDQLLWGNKERKEGIFTIVLQGIPVGAFVQSAVLTVLVLIGVDLHSKHQSEFTEHWLRMAVLFGIAPLLLGAFLLFWYPITTRVHEAILHGISERIYAQSVPLAVSVTPVLDPITGRLLTSIPKEGSRTEVLDHFFVWELKWWLKVADGGSRSKGLWLLRTFLVVEMLLCLGGLGGLLYLGITWGSKSDYFTLLILSAAVLLAVGLLQFLRIIASRHLNGNHCSAEEVRDHIAQLKEVYA